METWKQIPGYSAYEVSEDGQVRRSKPGGNATHVGKILVQPLIRGYPAISMVGDDGLRKTTAVHRVVCLAFHGQKPSDRYQVRHLNGNKRDNSATNLAWGTSKENHADRFEHGTAAQGVQNGRARLTPEAVREIRASPRYRGVCRSLSEKFGVSIGTINIVRQANSPVWKNV